MNYAYLIVYHRIHELYSGKIWYRHFPLPKWNTQLLAVLKLLLVCYVISEIIDFMLYRQRTGSLESQNLSKTDVKYPSGRRSKSDRRDRSTKAWQRRRLGPNSTESKQNRQEWPPHHSSNLWWCCATSHSWPGLSVSVGSRGSSGWTDWWAHFWSTQSGRKPGWHQEASDRHCSCSYAHEVWKPMGPCTYYKHKNI